jgi:hypothetical protein
MRRVYRDGVTSTVPQPGGRSEPASPGVADATFVPAGEASAYPGMPAYLGRSHRFTGFFTRLWRRTPRWAAPAAIVGCLGAAAGYTLWTDPTDGGADAVPTCLFKLTTGLACPGCGGTRAFWFLLHGDLPAAARHHLVFVFAVPFLIYAYVAWAGHLMFGWRLPTLRLSGRTVAVFFAAWFAFSVLRNLPWQPFTMFAV